MKKIILIKNNDDWQIRQDEKLLPDERYKVMSVKELENIAKGWYIPKHMKDELIMVRRVFYT